MADNLPDSLFPISSLNYCKIDDPFWPEQEHPELCVFYKSSIGPYQYEQETKQLYILVLTQKYRKEPHRCEQNYLKPPLTLHLIPNKGAMTDIGVMKFDCGKLHFKCIRMSSSFNYNKSFTKKSYS